MITYIGIDLGQKGGLTKIAKLPMQSPIWTVTPFWDRYGGSKLRRPTEHELYKILDDATHLAGDIYVTIEHPIFVPTTGKKAIASLHEAFGYVKGILTGLGVASLWCPTPQQWKKTTGAHGNDKTKMLELAQRITKHHGLDINTCDSVLIAEACRIHFS